LNLRGSAASGLLRSLLRRAVAPFRHEQIEFRLVLGLAQACLAGEAVEAASRGDTSVHRDGFAGENAL
jgi:hypothetical protein